MARHTMPRPGADVHPPQSGAPVQPLQVRHDAPMTAAESSGLDFPITAEGRRSTTRVGRAVVADALRAVDPAGARAAEQETNWRTGYLAHYRRLVESGLTTPEAAVRIADDGLASLHDRMCVVGPEGDLPLAAWPGGRTRLSSVVVEGRSAPETAFTLPYRGQRLAGDTLRRQLDDWVVRGIVEPTVRDAVVVVLEQPELMRLDGHCVVVLGAGAEMGPLRALLRWGATVAAVDLPRPAVWQRVLENTSAGRLVLPSTRPADRPDPELLGVDLVADVPALADWVASLDGRLVLGNYVYADGAANVRVSMAVDELSSRVLERRADTALAFLATPTDVFAVPGDAVQQSVTAYEGRSSSAKLLGRPLRAVSGGRLLRRAYVPGSDPGLIDSLVPQQGPNYALAKRLQRWRATSARQAGATVSMNVAPPTRTRSVVKNRALAAAYAGAHRFGVEVFEPATANVLMAALLVHDLHTDGGPRHDQPWQDEAYGAAHGGLWRAAYAPRSALGLAAVLGYGSAR
ncbi:conserved hypothetical protein [metagenome]|uniref:Uncharacterized protein n=1 Tax=metagenome TaxID=256318 RepID=A0A2P2CAI9_9ZZZZ